MRFLIKVLSLIFLVLLVNKSYAQKEGFNVGVIAGLNFSALEGEELTDYIGLNLGLIGTRKFSKKYQVAIEFLFSQNGEYIIPQSYPNIEYGQIRLNHLEIPFHFDCLFTTFKRDRIQNININLGIAYTRLISHSAKDINQIDIADQILFDKKEAFHLQTGLT